ncbi:HdeD family acid-resistance protein [Butyrivibrio sp. AE2032]|uniref:HdeD family acid-resistance protein n=1 Tax=Butyrivibrio sp. AE2032 TaxID=1458463 RepID=UPI0006917DDF|nr:DUF308 domain-containing protein [Butyrivibrio sp. AE2032]
MNSRNTKRLPTYIGGIFAIFAGVYFILYPEFASGVIGILFGIVLFVAGITEVIGYIISIRQFREENYGKAAGAEIVLVYSIILMALGVIFLLKTELVLQVLSTIVGIFFLIDGIVKLRQEIFLFRRKDIYSWVLLLLAVALIVAGIALLVNPFEGTRNIIVFTGAAFIVSGLETCFLGLFGKNDKKSAKHGK